MRAAGLASSRWLACHRARILWASRIAVASGIGANGVWMLGAPHGWFEAIPGVALTGAFNAHFIRDIGCAYLVAGAGIAAMAWRAALWPAAVSGSLFLVPHASVHVGEVLAGRCGMARLIGDAPGVLLPAFAALSLSVPRAGELHHD